MWAEAQDFTCWFTDEWKPWKRTQYNLPRTVEKGALTSVRHGKKFVYSVGKKRANNKADIEHGLICTKSLLKFKLARDGKFISEKFFRTIKLGSVPEWGVKYDDQLFLFEYSTADNFRRTRVMKKKIKQYVTSIPRFENYFNKEVIVLFVFDAERYQVKYFFEKYGQYPHFYFCDLASFNEVEIGNQLSAPIYFWMDGGSYPLT